MLLGYHLTDKSEMRIIEYKFLKGRNKFLCYIKVLNFFVLL
jgi:hypothetical protein